MCTRREAEGLIVTGLEEVKGLETSLNRRLTDLAGAPRQIRESFLLSLIELEEKALRLEQFVDALEAESRTEPAAA
jgi:hypothetical protein